MFQKKRYVFIKLGRLRSYKVTCDLRPRSKLVSKSWLAARQRACCRSSHLINFKSGSSPVGSFVMSIVIIVLLICIICVGRYYWLRYTRLMQTNYVIKNGDVTLELHKSKNSSWRKVLPSLNYGNQGSMDHNLILELTRCSPSWLKLNYHDRIWLKRTDFVYMYLSIY